MTPVPMSTNMLAPAKTTTLDAETMSPNTETAQVNNTEDMEELDTTQENNPKRKRKDRQQHHILHQTTYRKPIWTYFHLSLTTPGTASLPPSSILPQENRNTDPDKIGNEAQSIDALTVSSLLTPPLTSYLGLTGSSIPIDILKTKGREAWVRLPRQDTKAFQASLSGWIGVCEVAMIPGIGPGERERERVKVAWRIVNKSGSLCFLCGGGDGLNLFAG